MKELYLAKLQELKEIGLQIIENEDADWGAFEDEVETMDMHIDCCMRILQKAE